MKRPNTYEVTDFISLQFSSHDRVREYKWKLRL